MSLFETYLENPGEPTKKYFQKKISEFTKNTQHKFNIKTMLFLYTRKNQFGSRFN